jgi:PTS system ascorbate-specific IIA component
MQSQVISYTHTNIHHCSLSNNQTTNISHQFKQARNIQSQYLIVCIMHAPITQTFVQVAQHVYQNSIDQVGNGLLMVDVNSDDDLTKLQSQLFQHIIHMQQALPNLPVVVLNDLYGATPYHVAQQFCQALQPLKIEHHYLSNASFAVFLKAICHQKRSLQEMLQAVQGLGATLIH